MATGYPPNIFHKKRFATGGSLHHGQRQIPHTASIPTKYITIVTNNRDKKGFNAQSKRFNYDTSLTENPGPGRYKTEARTVEKQSTSFSKRGTGSFASKSSRSMKHKVPKFPDAATYNLPSLLTTRKDFNKESTTSSFQPPITLVDKDYQLYKKNLHAPAPNAYFADEEHPKKKYIIGKQKAFLSTAERNTYGVKIAKNPSPCHYNIDDNLTKRAPPALASVFSSKSKREYIRFEDNPGPGSYKPHDPVTPPPNRLTLPRKHYLCLSAPAMEVPILDQKPGPGTYEIVDYEGPEKHYMSSGVFVSNTSRWNVQNSKPGQPGPTTYKPASIGKQSYLFNVHNRWVPA